MAKFSIDLKTGGLNKKKKHILGIDLGTTNSLVAVVKDGELSILKEDSGNALFPSIVHIKPDGGVLAGEDAMPFLNSDPGNTVYSVKRFMGKTYKDLSDKKPLPFRIIDTDELKMVKLELQGKQYSPVELSAFLLTRLKKRAEEILETKVSEAVITVPAYFNDSQRQATRDAGKIAGLNVLRIVNEPTAAALAYGLLNPTIKARKIAVYDLGGGTFDLSILELNDGIFEVLSTNGDTDLGGDDIDALVVDHWMSTMDLKEESRFDLRLIAKHAKEYLSDNNDFSYTFNGIELNYTRAELEVSVDHLIDKTFQCCERAINDAEIQREDIDIVLMVGGSTRIPHIRKRVEAFFKTPIKCDLNPDEVVARGAAVQADILAGNRKDLLLLDLTPLSLGIETVGGLMDVLIPRNTTVPARLARQYTTSVDGQKNLKISVFQGERDLVQDNRKLGEFILSGIPPMGAGLPKIEIQFLLDANGILKVIAKELRSGIEQAIDIQASYGVSEEEMAEMLKSSIANAEQDMEAKSLIEAQTEARMVVNSTKKFIQQNRHWLDKEVGVKIESLAEDLDNAINEGSKSQIEKKLDQLNEFSKSYAHEALERNVSEGISGRDTNA